MKKSNFDKFPEIKIEGYSCTTGWDSIAEKILATINLSKKERHLITVECYHGVYTNEIIDNLKTLDEVTKVIDSKEALLSPEEINNLVQQYVTDDPVFGFMSPLMLKDFFDLKKIAALQEEISSHKYGTTIVIGVGASLIAPQTDLNIYADMPRWEIQLRFRDDKVGNLGAENKRAEFSYLYKRAFFVDWRVCDRHKKITMPFSDFILDTTIPEQPKMVSGKAIKEALQKTTTRPFRVVPFFDPGPWGGQWLKEVCDLDRSKQNFAWGFDCVPEENSLLFRFDNCSFEIPAIDLVFSQPKELLGTAVYEAFGDEFPIRFDFLDTMGGGNLSLQVHPLLEYIREHFGMAYTQDESYYFIEAAEDAQVYLGLKEEVNQEKMITQLQSAQDGGEDFNADQFVEKWPVKKHDHVLIPAGTVHCSGANSMVLEISATPYIFTFKLWDWGQLGLDGKPRPISLHHGKNVIQWNRTTQWTKENILNRVTQVAEGDGWREESTGLDAKSFIETRRHWFTGSVPHNTNGVFNILNLVDGIEVIVESPSHAFEPFIIHYAETFIVPAIVGAYTITPYGESAGKECVTIKAFVRIQNLINYQQN